MIQRVGITAMFCFLGAIPCAAAILPCASGTLASYISLGATGCTVGNLQFGGFEALPPEPGATSIPAASVTIAPISAGLNISYNQTADNGAFLDSVFGFDVNRLSGGTVTGEMLMLNGSSATGFAGVAGVGMSCVGAVSMTGTCSSLAARNLGVDNILGIMQLTDQVSYAGLALVGQTLDFSAQSTGSDTAVLGSVAATFTSAAAPEPSTFGLAGGVVALWLIRRGRNAGWVR